MFDDTRLAYHCVEYIGHCPSFRIISTIIGVFGALAIHDYEEKQPKNVASLNNVLIVSPDVIIGASFLILFTIVGIQLGFISVLLSHIAFSVPIVVMMVLPKLEEMSPTLIDAARDLGASRMECADESHPALHQIRDFCRIFYGIDLLAG